MKFGDLSSVIQLGVGLHLGSALFQLVSEFATAPLVSRLTRLRSIAQNKEMHERVGRAEDILAELEVKRIQLFNEFKGLLIMNSAIGLLLIVFLGWAAFQAEEPIKDFFGIVLILLSLLPAPVSLGVLWGKWLHNTSELRNEVVALESELLYAGGNN